MREFLYKPVLGAQKKSQPSIVKASFGDGYEQRSPNGIHHLKRSHSVTFKLPREEIDAIDRFLEEHGGYKAFIYYPADTEKATPVTCEEWSKKRISVKKSELTATFTEVQA